MGLQSQTVDVPLISLQQSKPTTTGVVGRLTRLNNAIAKRWQENESGSYLRCEKRDGFVEYGGTVHDDQGNVSSKTLTGANMIASRGAQLLALAGASIFACAPSANEWISPDYVCLTNELVEKPLIGRGLVSDVDTLPDSAILGTSVLTTWTEVFNGTPIAFYQVADSDGTVILAPRDVNHLGITPSTVTKCVSDGTRFWIVAKLGLSATYGIYAYDSNGVLLASNIVSVTQDADYFDIVEDTAGGNGFVFIQRNGAGPDLAIRHVAWLSGSIIVSPVTVGTGGTSTGRVAFLKNAAGNHKHYAVSIDGAGPYSYYVWEINDSTFAATRTTLATGRAEAPGEIAGWNDSGATRRIALSFMNGATQVNRTEIWTLNGSTVHTPATKSSLSVVSRAFAIANSYYAVGYYQSDPSTLPLTNTIQQSTFYLIDLNSSYAVCGAWNVGTAYADWQRSTSPEYWMQLSSPYVDSAGKIHFALSKRQRSFTTAAPVFVVQGRRGIAAFTGKLVDGNRQVNTVGLFDYAVGGLLNRAVEFYNETLIPGPRATSWTGMAASHGLGLVPEMPTAPVVAAAGAGLSENATYEVVAVAEWTNGNGEIERSPAGPPYAFSTGAGQRQATYSGYMLHCEAGKANIRISLYRTAFINGIQSQQHYKVTSDLTPVFNDDGSATWLFVDTMTDVAASVNEILYTDKGFLDRFPCPAFSTGVSDAARTYVIGYDGAVWFSGQKIQGDATWFSPAFRILPNGDAFKSLAIMDNTLVIFSASANIYAVPTANLPANDGSGGIPNIVTLPLTHGCTGPVDVCSLGVVFPSTQGGIWLVTRAFQDVFIGKDVVEFVEQNGPVVDIVVDGKQRVHCLTTAGTLAVFDGVTKAWYTWDFPEVVSVIGVNQGALIRNSGSPLRIARQTPGSFTDAGSGIFTTIEAQFQLGGVRNFKRIWSMQFEGEYRGSHTLTVLGYFDNDDVDVVETYVFDPDPALPYIYELPPKVEECANLTLEFTDSFPTAPSAGFALEMVSFELGVMQGLDRLAPSTRRKNSS